MLLMEKLVPTVIYIPVFYLLHCFYFLMNIEDTCSKNQPEVKESTADSYNWYPVLMIRTVSIIFHSVLAIAIVCVPLGLCTVQCIEAYINIVNITQPGVPNEQHT